ncbi:MAG: TlyA family RNA methyltransferase [Deltaproteobacteria bacterium]|nr:TlyA family RNA methyltransferase [Deltaproteobacteria bacterium]
MQEKKRKRLDLLLFEKGMAESREKARSLILAGKVLVNSQLVDKPGTSILPDSTITIKDQLPFVSRGGLKLQEAIQQLNIDVSNSICLDVGASTGGFTDCLLQNNAQHVYAVDVGYGQLAWTLRNDKRVTVIERTNIRNLSENLIPCPIDIVTIDVSFISLKIVVPAVLKFMKKNGFILALIKPQFEVGKGMVGKGGVVRDPEIHKETISDLIAFFTYNGLTPGPVVPSPAPGPKGNKEFMIRLDFGECPD